MQGTVETFAEAEPQLQEISRVTTTLFIQLSFYHSGVTVDALSNG